MNRRIPLLRVLAPLALMGLIFYLSSQPAGQELAWWEVAIRKLGHVSGYAALMALWAWALSGVVSRPLLVAVCIALAYACTDELHQSFVETRHGTPIDVGVDAIGIVVAATLIHARRPPHARRRRSGREEKLPGSASRRSTSIV